MAVKGRVMEGRDSISQHRILVKEGRKVVILKGRSRDSLSLGQEIGFDHVAFGTKDYVYFALHRGWWETREKTLSYAAGNALGVLYPRTPGSDTMVGFTVEKLRMHKNYGLVSVVAGFETNEQAKRARDSRGYGVLLITDPDITGIESELDPRLKGLSSEFPHDFYRAAHHVLCAADKGISSVVLSYNLSAFNQLRALMEQKQLSGKLTVLRSYDGHLVVPEVMRLIKEKAQGGIIPPVVPLTPSPNDNSSESGDIWAQLDDGPF